MATEMKETQAVAIHVTDPETKCEISNKDALRSAIHDIHNYMRNMGVGYGMNALKVFNMLYGLKKIEQCGLIHSLGLSSECAFSTLLALARAGQDEKLAELLLLKVSAEIYDHPQLNQMIFHDFPRGLQSSVFSKIIRDIEHITQLEQSGAFSLAGKVYEYFIGRDTTAIGEMGAFFTDRHIVNHIYKLVKPARGADGTIPTMIDMFGGSGGFTIEYINQMNAQGTVNWSVELPKIHHYDMNEDVVRSAALEFFCLTKTLPGKNVVRKNSFTDEFAGARFDYIFTNPPYGGDKVKMSDAQARSKKLKSHINALLKAKTETPERVSVLKAQVTKLNATEKHEKASADAKKVSIATSSVRVQAYAKAHGLDGGDKESVSFIMLMDMVAPGGTVAGVLKEGMFFDPEYRALRQHAIEHFNVSQVISIDNTQFENTNVKTSAIIFSNTGKTTNIIFKELVIDKAENDEFGTMPTGEVTLDTLKGDIQDVYDKTIISVSYDNLKLKNWSLRGQDYVPDETRPGSGYAMHELKSLCQEVKQLPRTGQEYKYVEIGSIENNSIISTKTIAATSSQTNAKLFAEPGDILVATVRPKASKILRIPEGMQNLDRYIFTAAFAQLRHNEAGWSQYMYAILHLMAHGFEKRLCHGSTYPRMSPSDMMTLSIPMPLSAERLAYWNIRLGEPFNTRADGQQNSMYEKMTTASTLYGQYLEELRAEAFAPLDGAQSASLVVPALPAATAEAAPA
jgi:type I restriction-modification system DNA methylase subunit